MEKVRLRPIVTVRGACQIALVSRRTIWNWIKANKVQWCRVPGGGVRVYVDSLRRPAGSGKEHAL